MRIAIEHSKLVYVVDFASYGVAIFSVSGFLLVKLPVHAWPELVGFVILGAMLWSILEYVLHRFVLHGLPPFNKWHAEHHKRPDALISTPTIISASLIVGFVYFPAYWLLGDWRAIAFTLGLGSGYIAYAVVHHGTHHWRSNSAWLKQRKRLHACHHHMHPLSCYGVTTGLWDRVFRTLPGLSDRVRK